MSSSEDGTTTGELNHTRQPLRDEEEGKEGVEGSRLPHTAAATTHQQHENESEGGERDGEVDEAGQEEADGDHDTPHPPVTTTTTTTTTTSPNEVPNESIPNPANDRSASPPPSSDRDHPTTTTTNPTASSLDDTPHSTTMTTTTPDEEAGVVLAATSDGSVTVAANEDEEDDPETPAQGGRTDRPSTHSEIPGDAVLVEADSAPLPEEGDPTARQHQHQQAYGSTESTTSTQAPADEPSTGAPITTSTPHPEAQRTHSGEPSNDVKVTPTTEGADTRQTGDDATELTEKTSSAAQPAGVDQDGDAAKQQQPIESASLTPTISVDGSMANPASENEQPSGSSSLTKSTSSSGNLDEDRTAEKTPSSTPLGTSPTPSATATPASGSGSTSATPTNAPTTTTTTTLRPAVTKKFTSSLSMNKKFLEKSGAATDGKSSTPSSTSLLPKVGLSSGIAASRSPSLSSPPIPGSTSASPTLANATTSTSSTPSSAPRLLTGKLSNLGSGLPGSGGTGSTTTWGRPGLLSGSAPGAGAAPTGFGKGPTSVPGAKTGPSSPPNAMNDFGGRAGGARTFQFGRGPPPLGGGPGSMSRSSGPGQAPWAAARGSSGSGYHQHPHPHHHNQGRPSISSMGHNDFPSFQETARAEQQRQSALLAKEKAEKMAAAAQAAYNQRVLEGLKSFSGVHNDPNAVHWDELDDDDDNLEDILEFADGMKYEVPAAATQPTAAEAAAFEEAVRAENEAAALHAEYEQQLAAEEAEAAKSGQPASDSKTPLYTRAKAEDFFGDDYDRSTTTTAATGQKQAATQPSSVQPSQQQPTIRDDWARGGSSQPPSSGRTLYNERLGRFEPYSGKPMQTRKQDRRTSPPALLQRPGRGLSASDSPATSNSFRGPTGQQQPSTMLQKPVNGATAGSTQPAAAPPTSTRAPLPDQQDAFSKRESAPTTQPVTAGASGPRQVENAWAKPPSLAKEAVVPAAQTSSTGADGKAAPSVPAPAASTSPGMATRAPPAQPPVDPEAEYKREMQAIAERARKRRQEEEAERQAQVERAKKKAAELEEKFKQQSSAAAANSAKPATASPGTAASSGKSEQHSTATTSESRADRQTSWRRPSVTANAKPPPPPSSQEVRVPVILQQRTLLQHPPRQQPQPQEAAKASPKASSAAPVEAPPKKTSSPPESTDTNASSSSTTTAAAARPSTAAATKAPPTSASLSALADFAFGKWRKPTASPPAPAQTGSEANSAPVVEKRDSVLPETVEEALAELSLEEDEAPLSAPSRKAGSTSPASPAAGKESPRVRLGGAASKTTATPQPQLPADAVMVELDQKFDLSKIPPHAFPRPTILVPSSSTSRAAAHHHGQPGNMASTAEPQQVHALDKIMMQVRAAQSDLKAKEALEAQQAEARKAAANAANKEQFEGALSRISQAIGEAATRKEKEHREKRPPRLIMPHVPFTPEVFNITQPERPPSPRGWKIFTVKVPPRKREYKRGDKYRFMASRNPHVPQPVETSSWTVFSASPNARSRGVEDFLFPRSSDSTSFVVKFTRFHIPAAADVLPEEEQRAASSPPRGAHGGQSGSITPAQTTGDASRKGRSFEATTWRRTDDAASIQEALQQAASASLNLSTEAEPSQTVRSMTDDEEDFLTVRYDEEEKENAPSAIKVSLPRVVLPPKAVQQPSTSVIRKPDPLTSPMESSRFRQYGPKVPENSTVVFRKGISPVRDSPNAVAAASTSNIFMVSSEIQAAAAAAAASQEKEEAKEAHQAALEAAEMIVERPDIQDEMMALVADSPPMPKALPLAPERKSSPVTVPDFPSLSSLNAMDVQATDKKGASASLSNPMTNPFSTMKREELPKHVLDELDRLNASVGMGAGPLSSLLEPSSSSLLSRTSSPWTHNKAASAGPTNSLSLSAIDPSMSLWSKPTDETAAAAAAAAAFTSSANANANKPVDPANLGMDDYPSALPRSAQDLPGLDGEKSDRDAPASASASAAQQQKQESLDRNRRSEERMALGAAKGQRHGFSPVAGFRSPLDEHPPHQHHRRSNTSSSRQGSFGYPGAASYGPDGIPSPYAMHTGLPYQANSAASPSAFSPGTVAPSYSPFVPAHSYGQSYPTSMQSVTSPMGGPAAYSHMPVHSHDGRVVSGVAMTSPQGAAWMQSAGVPGLVNGGQYGTSSSSPYLTSMVSPMQAYGAAAPQPQQKSRLFPHNTSHYSSAVPGGRRTSTSASMGHPYSGAAPSHAGTNPSLHSHSQYNPYASQQSLHANTQGFSAFSPTLSSPGGPHGGYGRAPSSSQYGRRNAGQGAPSGGQGHPW